MKLFVFVYGEFEIGKSNNVLFVGWMKLGFSSLQTGTFEGMWNQMVVKEERRTSWSQRAVVLKLLAILSSRLGIGIGCLCGNCSCFSEQDMLLRYKSGEKASVFLMKYWLLFEVSAGLPSVSLWGHASDRPVPPLLRGFSSWLSLIQKQGFSFLNFHEHRKEEELVDLR